VAENPPATQRDTRTLWFDSALLPKGWARRVRLSVEAGRITAIETEIEPEAGDERHGLGLPGLPNLHSHGFQRGMAGLTELRGPSADNFWSWRELMYRFVERLEPDDLEALTAQAYVEMLESGFTRVAEFHYLHHARDGAEYQNPGEMAVRVVAAAAATGIGLTLLPVLYCHSGFGGAPPRAEQRRFVTSPERYARLMEASRAAAGSLPDAVVGIAPHSLRAVTAGELATALSLSTQGPIHIHAAEQLQEVADCIAWSKQRPVEWLLDHAEVGVRWCLVHATHMTDPEMIGLAKSGAVAGLCPITEANLGDGIFRAREFAGARGRFGIGTDSNVLLDAAEELRLLEYSQRLTHRMRNVLTSDGDHSTGRSLFDAALRGGTQAVGTRIAGLAVGASADVVSLDLGHAALLGRQGDALLDSWIFGAGRAAIDCVWRGGRKLVVGGRHTQRGTIAARYRHALRGLLT
jgi:formiminoglutamate deiminase